MAVLGCFWGLHGLGLAGCAGEVTQRCRDQTRILGLQDIGQTGRSGLFAGQVEGGIQGQQVIQLESVEWVSPLMITGRAVTLKTT